MTIEYTVRPVVRYFVTRFEGGASQGSAWNTGSSYFGTFDNIDQANRVAGALAVAEGAKARFLEARKPVRVRVDSDNYVWVDDLEKIAQHACEDQL